jgi:hypothetical protein
MPDDFNLASGTGDSPPSDSGDSGGEGAPSYAPDHDSDAQHPKPGSDDPVVSREEMRTQYEAVNKALVGVLEQSTKHSEDEAQLAKELNDLKAKASEEPPTPPTPVQMPAPPNQQQKNGIAVLATNILKWSALAGLAYGLTRRSPRRNSLFKVGLAAALQGYQSGNNEARDKTLALWEKNRQFIMDQNREQHQQYEETLQNKRLTLQQKLDVFREQASMWANKRAQDAATRADIRDIQKTMDDQMRMERDFEKQIRQDKKEWYKHMGLSGRDGAEYRDWIMKQGGPDIRKAKDEDEEYAIESKYPIHQMLEEQSKSKREADVQEAEEKAKATARGKYEETQREEGAGQSASDNPLGLNLGQ